MIIDEIREINKRKDLSCLPEQNLMAEILFRAIYDSLGTSVYKDKRKVLAITDTYTKDAVKFLYLDKSKPEIIFNDSETKRGFTFAEICEALNLDIFRVHKEIKKIFKNAKSLNTNKLKRRMQNT